MSPEDVNAAGGTAQDYIDGVLQYWSSQIDSDNETPESTDSSHTEEMDIDEPTTPSTETIISPSRPVIKRPVIPQLQDYQQQLLALEHQNKQRVLIARERQHQAKKEQTFREQRNAAARDAHAEVQPPIEGYRSYLLSIQAKDDARLHQVREEEEEREAEERKRELERIWYSRRKDSGIYCETVYTHKEDYDCPIPEDYEGECHDDDHRRSSRIDSWVDAQTKRRSCGLVDDVMLPKKMNRLSGHSAVNGIFEDFKSQLSGLERYHEQVDQRRGFF